MFFHFFEITPWVGLLLIICGFIFHFVSKLNLKNASVFFILFSTALILIPSRSAISWYLSPSIRLIKNTTRCFSDRLDKAFSYICCNSLYCNSSSGETPFRLKASDLVYFISNCFLPVSYTHLRAHETRHDLVCRLLLE